MILLKTIAFLRTDSLAIFSSLIDSITESAQAGTKNEVQYIIDYATEKELSYEGILYVDKELMESFVTAGSTLEQAFAAFVEEYNVNVCIYGHLHNTRGKCPIRIKKGGVEYVFASTDALEHNPILIYES